MAFNIGSQVNVLLPASKKIFWVIYSYPDIRRSGHVKLELKFINTTPYESVVTELASKFALGVKDFEPGCRLSIGPKEWRVFSKEKHQELVALIGAKCLPPLLKSGKWGKPPCKNIPAIDVAHLPDEMKEKEKVRHRCLSRPIDSAKIMTGQSRTSQVWNPACVGRKLSAAQRSLEAES